MANETFPVEKSEQDWRQELSADQFRVLREHGTERAGTSPLNFEKRTGVFHCAACNQPLFESSTKYESGSGWPSFWKPLPNAVATNTDTTHGMARVEVHCKNCGGTCATAPVTQIASKQRSLSHASASAHSTRRAGCVSGAASSSA